jgi:hypothetical protein
MLNIYLTDLQAYNEGHLVGKWIRLPLTPFELSQALSEVLNEGEAISGSENHEEHFITDWEWNSHEFHEIDEYQNIYELNEQLQTLRYKSDYELKAIAFLVSNQLATDVEDAIAKADDVHIYENQTMEDIAYDLMQECYQADELPSIIANNIDYEGIARELEYDGTYYEVGSDVFQYVG